MSKRKLRFAPHTHVPAALLNGDTKRSAKSWLNEPLVSRGWSEVMMIVNSGLPRHMDCGAGCKIYARKQGCVIRYAIFHSRVYGCPL